MNKIIFFKSFEVKEFIEIEIKRGEILRSLQLQCCLLCRRF